MEQNKIKEILKSEGLRLTSLEVVDLINKYREIEGNKAKLSHYDFLKKIRTELGKLEKANEGNISLVKAHKNISLSSYVDNKNEVRTCYKLNRNGILQMLASESAVVRFEIIQYIDELETELVQLKIGKLESKIKEDEPFVELAKKNIDTTGTVRFTWMTDALGLKQGQISTWAKEQGFIHATQKWRVNKKGKPYFKTVVYPTGVEGIGITELGITLINDNIEAIKRSSTSYKGQVSNEVQSIHDELNIIGDELFG